MRGFLSGGPSRNVISPQLMRESLGDAVHLVVMLGLRKAQQLGFKLRQERCSLGEKNEPGLELCLMNVEPPNLVAVNRNGLHGPCQDFLELLSQGRAHGSILD